MSLKDVLSLALKPRLVETAWRKGIVAPWYLRPHQRELYKLIATTVRDIIIPNISRRFGKTSTCAVYSIEQAMLQKCHIRYATAFLSDLEEFIIPIFDHVLESCPEDLRPRYLASKKLYIFPNGSKIKLIGLDKNPNAIRGNAIDILIIDEAAFVKNLEYLYKSIIVPATADRPFKVIFPSTPPKDPDHFWAMELIPKAKLRGTYLEFTIDDNLSLSQEEKDRLLEEIGGKDSPEAQREFFCKIIRDPKSIVIPEFSEDCIKDFDLPKFYRPLTAIDFGGSMDKTGIIVCYWDFDRAKFCVRSSGLLDRNTSSDIIEGKTLELEKAISFAKTADGQERIDRLGDAPGQLRIDLAVKGFVLRPPQKAKGSLEAGINALRLAFMRGEIEIYKQGNKELIATLNHGSWLPNRSDFRRTDELGHLDLLAALMYAYQSVDKSNPYPAYYGRSLDVINLNKKDKTKDFLASF
jgi:hypothetical protein